MVSDLGWCRITLGVVLHKVSDYVTVTMQTSFTNSDYFFIIPESILLDYSKLYKSHFLRLCT